MANYIEILTFILFFLLIANIVKRKAIIELIFVIAVIIIATTGEFLNLFLYQATAYTDRTGIPIYIILGGTLIAWTYLKLPVVIVAKLKIHTSLLIYSDKIKIATYKQNTAEIRALLLALFKIRIQYFLSLVFIFSLLSLLFPVIEICGIKAGLWHWLKPYSLTSPWWWFGVWKFYMMFLGIPVIAGFILTPGKKILKKKQFDDNKSPLK